MRYVPNATRAQDPNVAHVPTAAPYTDRTPDDVTRDPRPGDTFYHTPTAHRAPPEVVRHALVHDQGGVTVDGGVPGTYGAAYLRGALASSVPGTARPRCLATDPRPGDTVEWGGVHREVVSVTADEVRSIDATGDTYTTPLDAWAVSARAWTACHDRKGGARFDPRPGDRAYAGPDVGWEVTARVGDLLALTPVRAGPDVTCPVEVWANAGGGDALFPARYVRAVRA